MRWPKWGSSQNLFGGKKWVAKVGVWPKYPSNTLWWCSSGGGENKFRSSWNHRVTKNVRNFKIVVVKKKNFKMWAMGNWCRTVCISYVFAIRLVPLSSHVTSQITSYFDDFHLCSFNCSFTFFATTSSAFATLLRNQTWELINTNSGRFYVGRRLVYKRRIISCVNKWSSLKIHPLWAITRTVIYITVW